MDAKKCDQCGEFYLSTYMKWLHITASGKERGSHPVVPSTIDNPMDLCSTRCAILYLQWAEQQESP